MISMDNLIEKCYVCLSPVPAKLIVLLPVLPCSCRTVLCQGCARGMIAEGKRTHLDPLIRCLICRRESKPICYNIVDAAAYETSLINSALRRFKLIDDGKQLSISSPVQLLNDCYKKFNADEGKTGEIIEQMTKAQKRLKIARLELRQRRLEKENSRLTKPNKVALPMGPLKKIKLPQDLVRVEIANSTGPQVIVAEARDVLREVHTGEFDDQVEKVSYMFGEDFPTEDEDESFFEPTPLMKITKWHCVVPMVGYLCPICTRNPPLYHNLGELASHIKASHSAVVRLPSALLEVVKQYLCKACKLHIHPAKECPLRHLSSSTQSDSERARHQEMDKYNWDMGLGKTVVRVLDQFEFRDIESGARMGLDELKSGSGIVTGLLCPPEGEENNDVEVTRKLGKAEFRFQFDSWELIKPTDALPSCLRLKVAFPKGPTFVYLVRDSLPAFSRIHQPVEALTTNFLKLYYALAADCESTSARSSNAGGRKLDVSSTLDQVLRDQGSNVDSMIILAYRNLIWQFLRPHLLVDCAFMNSLRIDDDGDKSGDIAGDDIADVVDEATTSRDPRHLSGFLEVLPFSPPIVGESTLAALTSSSSSCSSNSSSSSSSSSSSNSSCGSSGSSSRGNSSSSNRNNSSGRSSLEVVSGALQQPHLSLQTGGAQSHGMHSLLCGSTELATVDGTEVIAVDDGVDDDCTNFTTETGMASRLQSASFVGVGARRGEGTQLNFTAAIDSPPSISTLSFSSSSVPAVLTPRLTPEPSVLLGQCSTLIDSHHTSEAREVETAVHQGSKRIPKRTRTAPVQNSSSEDDDFHLSTPQIVAASEPEATAHLGGLGDLDTAPIPAPPPAQLAESVRAPTVILGQHSRSVGLRETSSSTTGSSLTSLVASQVKKQYKSIQDNLEPRLRSNSSHCSDGCRRLDELITRCSGAHAHETEEGQATREESELEKLASACKNMEMRINTLLNSFACFVISSMEPTVAKQRLDVLERGMIRLLDDWKRESFESTVLQRIAMLVAGELGVEDDFDTVATIDSLTAAGGGDYNPMAHMGGSVHDETEVAPLVTAPPTLLTRESFSSFKEDEEAEKEYEKAVKEYVNAKYGFHKMFSHPLYLVYIEMNTVLMDEQAAKLAWQGKLYLKVRLYASNPDVSDDEFNLNAFYISTKVKSLRGLIKKQLGIDVYKGLNTNGVKLEFRRYPGRPFIQEGRSLAYYNIFPNTILHLRPAAFGPPPLSGAFQHAIVADKWKAPFAEWEWGATPSQLKRRKPKQPRKPRHRKSHIRDDDSSSSDEDEEGMVRCGEQQLDAGDVEPFFEYRRGQYDSDAHGDYNSGDDYDIDDADIYAVERKNKVRIEAAVKRTLKGEPQYSNSSSTSSSSSSSSSHDAHIPFGGSSGCKPPAKILRCDSQGMGQGQERQQRVAHRAHTNKEWSSDSGSSAGTSGRTDRNSYCWNQGQSYHDSRRR